MGPASASVPEETSQARSPLFLQGKEEFEKTQKELLEKGSILRQGKGQLELQQVRLLFAISLGETHQGERESPACLLSSQSPASITASTIFWLIKDGSLTVLPNLMSSAT